MDELYRSDPSISCPIDSNFFGEHHSINGLNGHRNHHTFVLTGEVAENHEGTKALEMPDIIKAQIANHPLYHNLLCAHIECRKVGAPPEMASLPQVISKENHPISTYTAGIGADPELDGFMKSYCEVLHNYKEKISKPFDEATSFLSSIESQLVSLCKETLQSTTNSSLTSTTYHYADDSCGPSDENMSCGKQDAPDSQEPTCSRQGNHELKEMLMRKYSGYLSSLRKEFLKERKKPKLPKDARTALLDWWNKHYRWPYPTEQEKNRLSDVTGLDRKQINNWFVNQRKRHWRPPEDTRFTVMEGASDDINARSLYLATERTEGVCILQCVTRI
ncbi:hypothetical protein Pfo_005155 [Paulownia fortunei]|nr:hypothetical protein Pfo_005155 [Paulownia fortunei]